MILRAIIENQEDSYHYRIRIPILNKSKDAVSATSYDNLYIATVCTLPGVTINYAQGDVVFVGFERNEECCPVILGQLQRLADAGSTTDAVVDSLNCKLDFSASGEFNLSNTAKSDLTAMVEKITETL